MAFLKTYSCCWKWERCLRSTSQYEQRRLQIPIDLWDHDVYLG